MASSEKEGLSAQMPLAAGAEKIVLMAKACLLIAILAALYFRILVFLVFEVIANPDFSFVFLALPLWIIFLYSRRKTFAHADVRPEVAGVSLIVLACLAFIIGRASAEIFSTRVSLILLLAGLIWMFAGRRWLRLLSLPLLLLACFIPPPAILYNSLSNPVRDLLVRIASAAAQLLGLSFYADGGSVNVPGFSISTGDMCGSLHVIPALLISAL
ncbi:MAG: archaeosortase/exosortase family protein, partial [Candidatus Acidiferrales bacterium]